MRRSNSVANKQQEMAYNILFLGGQLLHIGMSPLLTTPCKSVCAFAAGNDGHIPGCVLPPKPCHPCLSQEATLLIKPFNS